MIGLERRFAWGHEQENRVTNRTADLTKHRPREGTTYFLR